MVLTFYGGLFLPKSQGVQRQHSLIWQLVSWHTAFISSLVSQAFCFVRLWTIHSGNKPKSVQFRKQKQNDVIRTSCCPKGNPDLTFSFQMSKFSLFSSGKVLFQMLGIFAEVKGWICRSTLASWKPTCRRLWPWIRTGRTPSCLSIGDRKSTWIEFNLQ